MIRIQSDGGVERRIPPIFVCDICNDPITKISNALVAFRDRINGEGDLQAVLHIHKGRCHDQAQAQMIGKSSLAWHELRDHLNDLVASMGVTVRSMIDREVSWSGALTPNQYSELQDRITDLGDWLRKHGVSSPLLD